MVVKHFLKQIFERVKQVNAKIIFKTLNCCDIYFCSHYQGLHVKEHLDRAWFAPRADDTIASVHAGAYRANRRGTGPAVADGGGGAAAGGDGGDSAGTSVQLLRTR